MVYAAAASEQVSEMGNPNYIDDAYSEDQDGTDASHLQDNVTVSSYVSNSTKKSSKSQKSRKSRQSQSSKGSRPTSAASSINSLKSSAKSSLPPESDSEDGKRTKRRRDTKLPQATQALLNSSRLDSSVT